MLILSFLNKHLKVWSVKWCRMVHFTGKIAENPWGLIKGVHMSTHSIVCSIFRLFYFKVTARVTSFLRGIVLINSYQLFNEFPFSYFVIEGMSCMFFWFQRFFITSLLRNLRLTNCLVSGLMSCFVCDPGS